MKQVSTKDAVKRIKNAAQSLDKDLKYLERVLNPEIVARLKAVRDAVNENAEHVKNNEREGGE